jgi:anti-anti-sigma regulatory factor
MNVKIDTKEKFHVITIQEPHFTANMTEDLEETFAACSQNEVKNIILNLGEVTEMDKDAANTLCDLQQNSYEKGHSLVFCCLNKTLEKWLDEQDLLELMNLTPTESEAWDIIQMEEIEREMFND